MAKTAEKTYTYSGPITGATLEDGRELTLVPGFEYTLPATDYTVNLIRMGRLTEKPKVEEA